MTSLSSAVVVLPKPEPVIEMNQLQSVVEVTNPVLTEIDRRLTCPILINCFISMSGRWNALTSYKRSRNELHKIEINTWIDASLRELSSEIRDICIEARKPGLTLCFAIIYPDKHSSDYRRREIGKVIVGRNKRNLDGSFRSPDDSFVTLLSKKFQIGDFVEVSIMEESRPNNANRANNMRRF